MKVCIIDLTYRTLDSDTISVFVSGLLDFVALSIYFFEFFSFSFEIQKMSIAPIQ